MKHTQSKHYLPGSPSGLGNQQLKCLWLHKTNSSRVNEETRNCVILTWNITDKLYWLVGHFKFSDIVCLLYWTETDTFHSKQQELSYRKQIAR